MVRDHPTSHASEYNEENLDSSVIEFKYKYCILATRITKQVGFLVLKFQDASGKRHSRGAFREARGGFGGWSSHTSGSPLLYRQASISPQLLYSLSNHHGLVQDAGC